MAEPSARRPSMEEFVREVTVALRAAGLEGELVHEREHGRLVHAVRGPLDLRACHDQLAGLPADVRTPTLAKVARLWVKPPELPATREEASAQLLPHVRTRMSAAIEDARRQAANTPCAVPRAEFTEHLLFELVIPAEGATLTVPLDALERWGLSVEEAFHVAGRNLGLRSQAQWLQAAEAPGLYASPWQDGFDACRLFLPRQFARVPLRGSPVVLAPTPSRLLLAGSDDPDGLFHLARIARRSLDKTKALHFLRAVRLGEDGESWQDFLPPKGHPAYDPLRLLRGIHEAHDYEQQAALVRQLSPPDRTVMPMPRLSPVQSNVGGESLTVTVWRAGKPTALPKADAVIFQRGEDVLGFAPWENLGKAMLGGLRPLEGYPVRYLATDFPEGWQEAMLDLKPWGGPLP